MLKNYFAVGKLSFEFEGAATNAEKLEKLEHKFETVTLTTRSGEQVKLQINETEIIQNLALVSHPFADEENEIILKKSFDHIKN